MNRKLDTKDLHLKFDDSKADRPVAVAAVRLLWLAALCF
jgi:hypothetical protein